MDQHSVQRSSSEESDKKMPAIPEGCDHNEDKGEKDEALVKSKSLESEDSDGSAKKQRSSKAFYDAYNEDDPLEKSHNTFPEKLMDLLEEESAKDVMWWLPGGDAFTIVPKNFSENVLDKFFQGTKFESFTRKLNRW
jgi:hypothetical protein